MGRTIAAVVEPGAANKRNYLEGQHYIITWAIGHLVGLAEPDHYDARYKRWNDADLPIIPDAFKLWPNPRTKDQLSVIGDLAKRCDRIVNACDAGREGQLIFHLIREYLKLGQPVDRLWISDLTPETIRRGFERLRSDLDYDPLTRAARARSQADWLIGMNASRAFTIRHRALLSVGRVQTPVLALIYDRHKEIESFNAETYYTLHGKFRAGPTAYRGAWQGDRLTSREAADAIAAKVDGKDGRIAEYKVTEQKEYPYKLYDLTLLQREANGKLGFSAKKTLDLAQALYEKHKVISYPRTNSNYVTEENIPFMHKALSMLQNGTPYAELAQGADRSRVHAGNKAVCNPSKVEDHHAILPTPKRASGLSPDEQKIYNMIVRRFLSHYYPPAVYNMHEVITAVEGETFKTKVKEQLAIGWKAVLEPSGDEPKKGKRAKKDEDKEDEEELLLTDGSFAVDADSDVTCVGTDIAEKSTQPPKPYTEGTLLKAMESAGKSIEDDELREAMKETGLGTPATRAATIERLKQVGYITLNGKRLTVTAKGIAAVELIRGAGVELLASPEMTGRWEQRLHQISRGEASDETFMTNVKRFAAMIVDKVRQQRPAAPGLFGEDERSGGRGKPAPAGPSKPAARTRSSTETAAAAKERKSRKSQAGGEPASRVRTVSPTGEGRLGVGLAECPRPGCGGRIIEGKRGFGCTNYRTGCSFVIWKDYRDKPITAAMAVALAEKGATRKLSFERAGGVPAKGRIRLADRSTGAVVTELDADVR